MYILGCLVAFDRACHDIKPPKLKHLLLCCRDHPNKKVFFLGGGPYICLKKTLLLNEGWKSEKAGVVGSIAFNLIANDVYRSTYTYRVLVVIGFTSKLGVLVQPIIFGRQLTSHGPKLDSQRRQGGAPEVAGDHM